MKDTPVDQEQALVAESVDYDKDLDEENLAYLKIAAIASLVDKDLANPKEPIEKARKKALEWKSQRDGTARPSE